MNKEKMKQRVIAAVVVLCMLLGFIPTARGFKENSFAVNRYPASENSWGEGTNSKYTITSKKNRTARFDGAAYKFYEGISSEKSPTSISIPDRVEIDGEDYRVTSIKAGALKDNLDVQTIAIGRNVKKIGKNAFSGCSNMVTIDIYTTKLTKKMSVQMHLRDLQRMSKLLSRRANFQHIKNCLRQEVSQEKSRELKMTNMFRFLYRTANRRLVLRQVNLLSGHRTGRISGKIQGRHVPFHPPSLVIQYRYRWYCQWMYL